MRGLQSQTLLLLKGMLCFRVLPRDWLGNRNSHHSDEIQLGGSCNSDWQYQGTDRIGRRSSVYEIKEA